MPRDDDEEEELDEDELQELEDEGFEDGDQDPDDVAVCSICSSNGNTELTFVTRGCTG